MGYAYVTYCNAVGLNQVLVLNSEISLYIFIFFSKKRIQVMQYTATRGISE